MIYKQHFLHMLLYLPTIPEEGTVVTITLEELTKALYCTTRNVKLVVRRLADDGFSHEVWRRAWKQLADDNPSGLL